jgi:hypothetical protein
LPGRSGSWPVEPQMWEAPVSANATSVGLDVHARSVVACGLDGRTGQLFERRLTPDHGDIESWIRSLPGPVSVTYEAGPTGSVWLDTCPTKASSAWSRPRRECSARLGIGSRPTCGMRGTWRGCCTWVRSSRSRCPASSRKQPGTWCGPARMSARI